MKTTGLIEKVAADLGTPASRNAPGAPRVADAAKLFDIDFERLKEQGFYAPGALASQLELEMRAVKRRLLRRIGFLRSGAAPRVTRRAGRQRNMILVASTRPGEGKTFTAINLALSFALEDEIDVLLVDADTPRPKVMSHFGLEAGSQGLTDRLSTPSLPVSSLVYRARQAGLSILPEGAPVNRASDLFASEEAKRLFTELSIYQRDGLVIIDAPPVLAMTDTVLLAKHVDEIIFVVEADATPQPAIASAIDELLDVNPNVSLLLNRCLVGGGGSHYGSYKEYYSEESKTGRAAANHERQGSGYERD